MVGYPLEVHGNLHGGDDEAKVAGHGVVFHKQCHPRLVDDAFKLVHLVVIGDDGVREFEVALQQGADGAFEIVAGLRRHREDVAFQFREGVIEVLDDVRCGIHRLF